MSLFFKLAFLFSVLFHSDIYAVPIDWHGVFGADTTIIDNYRRVEALHETKTGVGSEEVSLAGGKTNASFQSYIFHLNPHVVINDSTSFKSELSLNSGSRSQFLGDSQKPGNGDGFGTALYPQNFANNSSGLAANQFYMELYADTATYIIGRHTSHYGLGAVINSGDNIWDRHAFARDGISMKVRLGNFTINPYWGKVAHGGTLTDGTRVKDYGASLIYDNLERDLGFGILYGKKKNSSLNDTIDSEISGTATALGKTDVKVTDLYFKKGFGKFSFQLEVPLISGDIGNAYGNDRNAKYNAKAIIFETKFDLSDSVTIGLNGGKVDGDGGTSSSYEAMYLNPNYKIANLLFAYNLNAINGASSSLYNSYVTNVTYLKLFANFKSSKWNWTPAFIWARANEVAKKGVMFHDHMRNRQVMAQDTQSDDLGMEIDLNFTYDWNDALQIGGKSAYLLTGDYFAFTNDPVNKNKADNSYLLQLNAIVHF